MILLIIGTPDSGKSKKAEDLALELSDDGKRIYIATMIPFGYEGRVRVEKHRKQRSGKGFETLEMPVDIDSAVKIRPDIHECTCLLECMSNLIGNEMHRNENKSLSGEEIENKIVKEVVKLSLNCRNLVIVTNKFLIENETYDEETREYVRYVANINARLGRLADKVYEIRKGEWSISENN